MYGQEVLPVAGTSCRALKNPGGCRGLYLYEQTFNYSSNLIPCARGSSVV